MQDQNENVEVKTEPVIGKFKPKRKFLNFVSASNNSRIRFIRDVGFIKGEKLSGILEGVIFKITICDNGTINFEEQKGSNLTDESMIKRLINDIDTTDVTGYAQKFVVSGLEFNDINGDRCYLEVEHKKPINQFRALFEETETETEISERGLSFLDDLLSSDEDEIEEKFDEDHALSEVIDSILDDLSEEDVKTIIETNDNPPAPTENLKVAAESYMEQQFRKMNEEKVLELEYRIEETQKEIIRFKNDAKSAEKKAEEKSEALGVLETRLETMKPGDEPNGYVFFISEEIKDMESLSEEETKIALKISDIMKLKGDVIVKMLTEGYYKIKIAKKDDITNQDFQLEKEIYQKIMSIDIDGKMKVTDDGFEYRGKLNWHQLVSKMIRNGFEQEPEFDKLCQSNSYESHEEEKETEMNLGGVVIKSNGGFVDMGNGIFGVPGADLTQLSDSEDGDKQTTDIKSKEVRTYNEETTLVVMGTVDYNDNRDVEITDDYTGFGVYIGDKKMKGSYYESDGFISIMTLPEFKKWQSAYPDSLTDGGGVDSFLLPNFKGTIGITAKVDGKFTNEFDLSDYIQHQDGMEDAEVFLTLPEGTEVMKMDDYHRVPVAGMRDIKIDKLINVNDMKVLTTKQLETVEYYKSNYDLDITKNWFMFDTQSDDQDFLAFTGYNFFVTIQPERGWDQDPSCEDFLPESIKDLENYTDCVFGYSGDLSESEFIEVMNNSPFFNYVND